MDEIMTGRETIMSATTTTATAITAAATATAITAAIMAVIKRANVRILQTWEADAILTVEGMTSNHGRTVRLKIVPENQSQCVAAKELGWLIRQAVQDCEACRMNPSWLKNPAMFADEVSVEALASRLEGASISLSVRGEFGGGTFFAEVVGQQKADEVRREIEEDKVETQIALLGRGGRF
jgi:hypothetical protein